MKGQMFIIAAIILIVGMVLLKNFFTVYDTVQENIRIETTNINKLLENIVTEYEFISGLEAIETTHSTNKLSNFTNFIRLGENMKTFYASIRLTLIDENTTQCSIKLGNYMKNEINITVNSSISFDSTVDGIAWPLGSTFIMQDKTEQATSKNTDIQSATSNIFCSLLLTGDLEENLTTSINPTDLNNTQLTFFDIELSKENMLRTRKKITRKW